MIRRTRIYWLGAIVGGLAAAALIPLAPAVSQESPPATVIDVEVVDPAILGARGAVAFVTVQYTCTPGAEFAQVSVQLNQRSGSGIAQGFGGQSVTCDGTLQEVTVVVSASGRAFKKGVAFATAFASLCQADECVDDLDREEIDIVRA